MSENLNLMEALKVTTQEVKKYTDNNAISCNRAQSLGENAKTLVKNNIGIYTQPNEPANAVDGDIWIDTDDESVAVAPSNWNANESTSVGYVYNRPLWLNSGSGSMTWDGQPTGTKFADNDMYLVSELTPSGEDLVGGIATICIDGVNQKWPISAYYKNYSTLENDMENLTDTSVIVVVDGVVLGGNLGSLFLISGFGAILGMVIPKGSSYGVPSGIYASVIVRGDDTAKKSYFISGLNYEYSNVIIDDRYRNVFKKKSEANVFVVDVGSTDITTIDYGVFNAGDVILVIGDDELAAVKT